MSLLPFLAVMLDSTSRIASFTCAGGGGGGGEENIYAV